MTSLFGGKTSTQTSSKNPAWLDKAGEELYNTAKGFVFNPSSSGIAPTNTSPSMAAPAPAANNMPGSMTNTLPAGLPQWYAARPRETWPAEFQNQPAAGMATPTGGAVPASGEMSFDNVRGLPQYTGQRVADMTNNQNQASWVANDARQNDYGFDTARGYVDESTARYGKSYDPTAVNTGLMKEGDLDRYLNPYMKIALESTSDEMRRNADIEKQQTRDHLVNAGAFGGSRQALMESENNRNLLDRVGSMFKSGMSEGYDRSLAAYMQEAQRGSTEGMFNEGQRLAGFNANRDQFNGEQNRLQSAANAYNNIATTQSNIASQDVERLLRTGGTQQEHQQNLLDTAHQDFVEQRDWPYKQLDRLTGIVNQSPSQGAISTTVTQKPSMLAQLAGAGLSLAQGAGALGYKI